ncbi:hypothetical protein GF367_01585 [Candidatus Woesearchaeota archaeon]|nr:hypothetical protein [Candidatus Woesearchaeota archaeon]
MDNLLPENYFLRMNPWDREELLRGLQGPENPPKKPEAAPQKRRQWRFMGFEDVCLHMTNCSLN